MVVALDAIKVDGLAQFNKALKQIDKDAPKQLRMVGNEAASIVSARAQSRVARQSGRAQRSIKANSTRTLSRVKGGGPKQPYYPWLEFGGRVGKRRSIKREFIKSGRYIYPSYAAKKADVQDKLTVGMRRLAAAQGWKVTNG